MTAKSFIPLFGELEHRESKIPPLCSHIEKSHPCYYKIDNSAINGGQEQLVQHDPLSLREPRFEAMHDCVVLMQAFTRMGHVSRRGYSNLTLFHGLSQSAWYCSGPCTSIMTSARLSWSNKPQRRETINRFRILVARKDASPFDRLHLKDCTHHWLFER